MKYDRTQALIELRLIKRRLNDIRTHFHNLDIHVADTETDHSKLNSGYGTGLFISIHSTLLVIERFENHLVRQDCVETNWTDTK